MNVSTRTWVSLGWRTVVALIVLSIVTLATALTGAVAAGIVILLAIVIALIVLGALTTPFPVPTAASDAAQWIVTHPLAIVVVGGALAVPFLYVRRVRADLRAFRAELRGSGSSTDEYRPEVAQLVSRLAQQANIPEPDVYIADRKRAESYAVGGQSDGSIIVTRELFYQLSDAELQAVLAHEVAHLANGDSRVVDLALVPMLLAEHVGADEPPNWLSRGGEPVTYIIHIVLWAVLRAITTLQYVSGRFGATVLTRGREFAADRTAAMLTGSPGALASALRTLDDDRGPPNEDKRTWATSASALDILPRADPDLGSGLLRTHPPTDERIRRLERLEVEMVSGE